MSSGASLGRYARTIESALGRARQKPVLLSPRDWDLVSGWHRDRVPLRIVVEVIEEAGRRTAAKGSTFASLAYVAREVEEAWRLVRSDRATERAAGRLPLAGRDEILAEWARVAREAPRDEPLAAALRSILARLHAGERFDADAAVDDALLASAPEGERAAAERDSDAALAPWRGRMSAEAYGSTRRRAIIDRLRAALGIPRLSLAR